MAEPEKAIIDSLISKKVPLDEIISSIKNKSIDTKKLINYAIKTKNKSLIKRLGFILEENKYNLQKRLKFVDNNYVVLDTALEKKGKLRDNNIVLFTASDISETEITRLKTRGVKGALRKPVSLEDLNNMIMRLS